MGNGAEDGQRSDARDHGDRAPASSSWRCVLWMLVALLTVATSGCRAILGIHDLVDDTDGSFAGRGDASSGESAEAASPREGGGVRPNDAHAGAGADASLSDAEAGAAPQPTAQLATNQKTLDFGTVVSQSTPGGQIQVTNTGAAPTGALTTSLTGAGFSVVVDGCVGVTLGPALSCRITLGVTTVVAGPLSGSIVLTDTPSDRVSVSLVANVIAPGTITVTPARSDLGGVLVGSTSMPATLTVTNTRATPTGPLTTLLGGTSASELSMVDGCTGKSLAAMGTCAVTVTLSPVTAGPKTASLAVSGAPGGTGTASLTGSGIVPASLSIAPASSDFNVVLPRTGVAPSATFVVTNSGNAASGALTTGLVFGSGTAITDFVVTTDTCKGQMLAAMMTCSVTVEFRPVLRGNKSASLAINGGPPSSTLRGVAEDQVPLSVTKSGAGGGRITDNQGAIDCGTVCRAQYPRVASDPVITLVAAPDASSVFAGWSGGGCSGTGPCVVTAAAATIVDARFDPIQLSLTVNFHGIGNQVPTLGSVPAGISCSGATCASMANFPFGTRVVLTVTQSPGALVAWSASGCSGTSCSVTMTSAQTVNVTSTNQNIVFESSQPHDGNFGGLAGANAFCNAAAQAAGVPGRFAAFLGTSAGSPFSNLGAARGWIRPDGLPFTDTVSSFQSYATFYPASVTELGTLLSAQLFTGIFTGAVTSYQCADWTGVSGLGSGGIAMAAGWFFLGASSSNCSGTGANILCFGTDFSVPVTVAPVAGRRLFAGTGPFVPSGGVAAADALCQSEATGAGLANPTHFLAALATTTASAASRFNLNGTPWVRTDGVQVATTTANFMAGTLLAPPATDQNGTVQQNGVWLGSSTGMLSPALGPGENCNNWSTAAASATAIFYPTDVAEPNAFAYEFNAPTACSYTPMSLLCLEN